MSGKWQGQKGSDEWKVPYLARRYANPVFKPVNNVVKLDQDLYFFTDIPREPGSYAPTQGKFFNEDGTGPCPIIDDATLVVRTSRGMVAIFGCAHAGYVNILKAIRKEFPNDKLLSVVGGLHLQGASEKVLAEAASYTDTVKAEGFASMAATAPAVTPSNISNRSSGTRWSCLSVQDG